MTIILFIIMVTTGHSKGYAVTEEDRQEMRNGLERWVEIAKKSTPSPEHLENYISLLGSGIRKTRALNIYQVEERVSVSEILIERLLDIPGHAIHYRDRINHSRGLMEEAKLSGAPNYGSLLIDSNREERWGFATLENLPSVETVGVLGEFLSDDRGSEIPMDEQIEMGGSPNNRSAVFALSRLGIANPPTPPMRHTGHIDEGLGVWQTWYQQVKDGRRTFRFIDDPVDYDLRGPSRRGAVEPMTERSEKRSRQAASGHPESDQPGEQRDRISPLYIGGFMLLAGLGIYLSKRLKAGKA